MSAQPDKDSVERWSDWLDGAGHNQIARMLRALQSRVDALEADRLYIIGALEGYDSAVENDEAHPAIRAIISALQEERDTALAASGAVAAEVQERCAQHVDAGIYMGSDGNGNAKTKKMTGAYLRSLPLPTAPSAALAKRMDEAFNEGVKASVEAYPKGIAAIEALKRSGKEGRDGVE